MLFNVLIYIDLVHIFMEISSIHTTLHALKKHCIYFGYHNLFILKIRLENLLYRKEHQGLEPKRKTF